jgi:transposase
LLWEEYRQENPDGYQYSRFCELYQRWRRKQDVVLRQEHKAGEKLFVDWAGTTIPIHDPRGGPVQRAHLFVAVLGASSYTYAEATPTSSWQAGLALTSAPLSSIKACRSSWCRTTQRPA